MQAKTTFDAFADFIAADATVDPIGDPIDINDGHRAARDTGNAASVEMPDQAAVAPLSPIALFDTDLHSSGLYSQVYFAADNLQDAAPVTAAGPMMQGTPPPLSSPSSPASIWTNALPPGSEMIAANQTAPADNALVETIGGGIVISPETVTLAGSQLVFVNTYSSTVSDAYRAAIIAAEHELQSNFSNNVTITVSFGYANLGAGFLAQNSFGNAVHTSYATLRSALQTHATSADDIASVNSLVSLPDPSNGAGFLIGGGMARLLGLPGAGTSASADVQLVLGSAFTWNFDPNNRADPNGYDAIGTIQHEITEGGFGRVGGLGYQNHSWAPMDLFRFSSAGVRDFTGGQDGQATFFSVDNGQTLLTRFHSSVSATGVFDGQDPGDWDIGGDSFGFGGKGVTGILSSTDLRVLDVLGWTRTGSTPPPTDDFRNSLTDTTHPFGVVAINGSATGNLEVNADRDWFQVTLAANTTYQINLLGQQGGGGTLEDPYLRVHNGAGTLLAENDDIVNGVNRDSQLTFTSTTAGIYYLDVGAFADGYSGTYRVSVASAAPTDDFRNSLTDTTHPFGAIVVNGTATGNLEINGDRDWFQVNLAAGSYIVNLQGVQASAGTLADPYLRVHNSAGTLLSENDDITLGINRDSQLVFTAASAGTYYLEAGAYNDGYTGTYRLGINATALADDFRDSLTDTTHPFGSITLNSSSAGTLDSTGDRDWFQVQLTAGTTYTINMQGFNAGYGTLEDPYIRIHNSAGTLLAENDDIFNGVIRDSLLTFTASASGTYYVEAGAFADSYTGTYRVGVASASPFNAIANFGQAQGWSSENSYPRLLADVNGDHKDDIVGFGQAGTWVALATSGGNFSAASFSLSNFGQAQGWSSDSSYHRVLADVNGDGKADIVGFGQSGTWVSLATSGGSFAAATLTLSNFGAAQGWSNDTTYHREVADVNGDGMADIVGFGQAGVYVALATGNGLFSAAALQLANFTPGAGGWSSDNTYHREVADINGDGMADIVGFGQGGAYVSLATGSGHFGASSLAVANFGQAQGWSTLDSYPRHLADVNGDGFADIVGFGQSRVLIAFSTGNGQFSSEFGSMANYAVGAGGWSSNTTFPRLVGDTNGDGHAEIVGFGAAGTLSSFLLV